MSCRKKVTFPNVFAFALYLNIFASTLSFVPINLTKGMYLLIGTLSLSFTLFTRKFREKNFFIFLFIYTITFLLSHLYNSNSNLVEILWPLGFMSIGYMLATHKISYRMTSIAFYFYLVFVVSIALIFKNVRLFSSLNGINVNILLLMSLYYISSDYSKVEKKEFSLLPPILSALSVMLLSLNFLGGRSGTIVFIFVFSIFLFSRFIRSKKKFITNSFLLITGTLCTYQFLGEKIIRTVKMLTARGAETIRFQLWKDYLFKLNEKVANVIFGAGIFGTELLEIFSENLHNAFFMLHAKYGIVMLLIVLVMIVVTLLRYLFRRDVLFSTLFLAMILRMFFDYTNFNSILDILFIYFIFNKHKSLLSDLKLSSEIYEGTSTNEIV